MALSALAPQVRLPVQPVLQCRATRSRSVNCCRRRTAFAASSAATAAITSACLRRLRKASDHRGRRQALRNAASTEVPVTDSAAESRAWRSWAEGLGIEAPKVELTAFHDAYGGSLRGMVASAPVESDEAVITVPAKRALQVTTGGPCPIDDIMDASAWQRLPWWAQLAVLLLREVREADESPLSAWTQSLPKQFDEIPMNWSDTELALLEYPPLVQRVTEQRAELQRAYEHVVEGCSFPISEDEFRWAVQVVRSRAFSGPYEGRGAEDRLTQLGFILALLVGSVAGGFVSLENGLNGAFAAAFAIPLTDFLVGQSSQLKRHVVCPVVDYLNHDSTTASDIAYEYFADLFAVRVRGGFKEGEQVCINYGEKRSNDTLLQYYGFVERDNANDTYSLDLLRHLDEEAAASGQTLQAELSRTGPDEAAMKRLLQVISGDQEPTTGDEALAWKAVALACEAELQQRSSGSAHDLTTGGHCRSSLAVRFAVEKEKVLTACRAHAEARRGRPASAAPLSLLTRSVILPTFQDPAMWKHTWADEVFGTQHMDKLHSDGFCIIKSCFDPALASACLKECEGLDDAAAMTVTTNPCNRGSRSAWLDFGDAESSQSLQQRLPALSKLSLMMAGLPLRVQDLGGLDSEGLRVHPATMVAVYPEQAAEYSLHKDSYAPADSDPATGATRRLTVLAYMNDWSSGKGGELRLHEASGDRADPRRFQVVEPMAGSLVIFDSRRTWHAVAPTLQGNRWAVTLWVH